MTLGQQISSLRRQKGMKQYELADAAKLSASYISRIENGISRPTHESIVKIAAALDVTVQDILRVEYEFREDNSTAEKIKVLAEQLPDDVQAALLSFMETLV